jgi:hypothetical protein
MNSKTIAYKCRWMRVFMFAAALVIVPVVSSAATFISVNFAPPALPVYAQPIAPGSDFMWIPGYWAWNGVGYYWVPGTWVLAPYVGALWTPGWWGWSGAAYLWHPGYWGSRVGYYGGINYGFGYFGVGYAGGYWSGGRFFYNTAVTRVDVTRIHNTYNRTIVENNVRTSYNGGAGGVRHEATADERLAERDVHRAATPMQLQHERFASTNRQQLATANNGSPALTATPRAYNRNGAMDTRVTREANVQRGSSGPQGQHDRIRADRSGSPGQPQARNMEQPHAGGPPQERAARMQGGPQDRPEGGHQGGHREGGGERHEGR